MGDDRKKAEFVKGVRHLGSERIQSNHVAGRSLDQQIEDIRREGTLFPARMLRNSIIGGLEIRLHKGNAENIVICGCVCFGSATLQSFCRLMQKMGLDYGFLDKEYCCGAPLLHLALIQGEDRTKFDELGKEFSGLNIELSRQKGAQNIVYFCPWCLYIAKRFYPEDDNLIFFPEILERHIDKLQLRLEGKVGYFGGTPHRRAVYDPDVTFDLQWDIFPRLLDRVEGLEVVKIPRYCCMVHPELIYEKARQESLHTIVTPCVVCYGGLSRKAPPDIKIRFITDLLLQAVVEPAPTL